VRQQWNFSLPGTVREIEDYAVTLPDVTVLELNIVPDQSGGEGSRVARAFTFRLTRERAADEEIQLISGLTV
jgi:hypothetical protein